MIQEILMWISVVGAFGYTAYSFVKAIWEAYQPNTTGCSSGCGGCGLKSDILKGIKYKQLRPVDMGNAKR